MRGASSKKKEIRREHTLASKIMRMTVRTIIISNIYKVRRVTVYLLKSRRGGHLRSILRSPFIFEKSKSEWESKNIK